MLDNLVLFSLSAGTVLINASSITNRNFIVLKLLYRLNHNVDHDSYTTVRAYGISHVFTTLNGFVVCIGFFLAVIANNYTNLEIVV